ncbi:DUF29 domain-containing protein [Aureimonas sp. AU12]|uniref:DUF29 domain-containing protein n=1 Tax=Aureimonas sp. AU12 TaxID=1638161 RepID=UPI000A9BA033|nr:DUF29 domain-containing protein [Aureimonas sp. AU12]
MTTVKLRMATGRRDEPPTSSDDRYFFRWTEEQADLLRARRFDELDTPNLIDEVETWGRSVKREIESRMKVLVVHLMEWRFQPERRSRSWTSTIAEHCSRIRRELRDSPGLRAYPATILAEDYAVTRLLTAGETDLPDERFPEVCPFTIEAILDPGFQPDAA